MNLVCEWEGGEYFYKLYVLDTHLIMIVEKEKETGREKCSVFKKVEKEEI